jgi:recombination protein RecA
MRAKRFPGAALRPSAPQARRGGQAQVFQFPPPRCDMTDEREKLLAAAISQIEKDHGKGAIMRLGSRDILVPVSVIPSGCLSIDAALGVGGFPRGRVIEIYGPESGGKTTMTLHVIAEAQKLGGQAAFIDAEHALDPVYARKLGVDVDNLLVSQPDNGEQALEIAETLIRSGGVDIVVVDSVAALVPKAELEGDMGDPQMGLQARLMSQALRKLTGIVSKSRTCLIFINQIREKIGVMFGNPETTTGGRALKFYASMRVDIRRIQAIKEGDKVVGSRTRAKVVKNKVAAPFREAEFDIVYGEGISREGDLIDLGVEKGVLEKSGTWISFGGERMGQGRENARIFLKENKDIRDKLENTLRKKLEIPVPGNSNAAGAGANGHAAPAQAEKPPMKAAAAVAGPDASKVRPTR